MNIHVARFSDYWKSPNASIGVVFQPFWPGMRAIALVCQVDRGLHLFMPVPCFVSLIGNPDVKGKQMLVRAIFQGIANARLSAPRQPDLV